MSNEHKPYGPYEKFFKPLLDRLLALIFVILFAWLYLILAVLVRVKLGKPVLFKQERPGKNEEIFCLYKFRTMTDTRDENGELLPDEKRTTEFGNWLRKTSLDELPEIINIIKGDMSIVGPRPLLVRYLPFYKDEERHRHDVKPGLTGLAQINGRNFLSWEERFELDIEYANSISFWGDVSIILHTVNKVVKKTDIADPGNFKNKQGKVLLYDLDVERSVQEEK